MAKPLVHMIPSQEAKWNTSVVTAAATLETSRAVEATTTGSAVQQRQQQYQQQYQQSSTLSSSADISNSSNSSDSSKLVGHEVTRSSTVISVTESQSTSTDTVTTTGDDSIASYFVEQQQPQQPQPQQQQQIAEVSTDTAQQVWMALSEIESYIDLTRQQSTVLKEEEEEAEQQQASSSQTDTTSSSSQTDMNRLLSKVSSTTSYQRLQDEEDVFEEEKKEDDHHIIVDHTVVPVENLAAAAVVPLPDTALHIIDEAKVEEEEGEEVEAPTDLMSKHNKDAADLATIPAKNGGRLRFEGIFGLSMASVRNIKDKRESNVKQKGGLGKVAVVQQDGTKRDVEVVQQEDTSICTESSLSCDTGSTSSASGTTTSHGASKRIPPTANLSRSYQSLQQMRSSHRTTVSVAQSSAEVFEVVSGELVSSNITSPSEAMARRASSKVPTSPPTRHIAIPAEINRSVSNKDVEDAVALAALKKVASSSSKQNTEHSHHEVESFDILRAASSYSSVGAVEQSAVPPPPDKLNVKIEELEDTIELKRTKTIRPEPTAEVTSSFEETEEEPLKVTVRNDNDTIELLRTRTHESWSAATEENESSVHSSTVTVPTTKVFKVVVKQDASDGAVEILRSASMQSSGAANQVSTPSPLIAKGKKPLKVSFQDKDQVIELVRDSSTGLTEGDKDLQNAKSADSCDTTCNGSTFSTEPRPMNIVDNNAECVIEVRRPGSSSSLFSRNAPFLGPPEEEMPPPPSAEQGFVIMARTGSHTQSIRSGASPKRNIRFLGTVPVEEAEKKALVSIGQPNGPRFVAHGEEPSLPEPIPGEGATNMECISVDGSRVSTKVSIEGPASAFFQEEAAAPLKPPAPTHVSPKDTIESTPEGLETSSNIPRLPAPAKDTTSVHVAGALLEQNLESVSRRKRQLLKSRNNNRSIPDSSSSNASTVDMKVIASEQKGVEVAPEDDFPDPFLCTPEHMVHVNVLGVAGIVVDRNACNSFAGQKILPSAPEAMKMVVGIAERGSDRVSGVTAFSKTLIPSPNGKMDDGKHRHVAVWASNNEGMTPGSLVSSDLITMERVDPENPKSRYKPKFFDLTIALAKDTKQENHVALPIGVAKLKVNGDFVSHGEMITMDLPVYTLEQSQKLNEMNTLAGESPQAVQFLKLKTKDCKKSGIKGIFHRKANQLDGDMPTEQESKALSAAYAIDPTGDSMIRVQVRVETLGIDKDETDLETPNLDGVLNDEEDPCDGTASTDPTENDSLDSLKSDSLETSSDSNDGQKKNKGKKELIDKAKPRVIQLGQSDAPKSLYSTPLDVPQEATKESSETVPSIQYVSKDNKEGQTELRIFGKALMAAKKLDDEIEQVAEKLFGQNVPFSKTTPGQDIDGNLNDTTVEEDESLLIREGSLHASLSGMGDNITTGSMIGPVPTVDEIKAYLKEQFGIFALKSGEFFFPEDPNLIHDDSSSIGDATLEAFMNGQLRMRTMDSSTWRKTPRGDDDSRTYDTCTSYESEPTIALRPFGEASNDNGKKTPMETVQEEDKRIDPPTENNTNSKSPKIATIEEGDEDDGDKDDDDDDDEEGTLEEENDGDDEMSFRTPPPTKRSSSRSSSSSHPRSVAESVVESLVDVLARYPLCGANYMGTASTAKKERMKVPTTLEPDLLSVGDLTAATLEQHHHQAEASTRNPSSSKSSQSRIHPYVSAPLQAAAGLFACGANADTVDDSVARRSTPIQFTRSGSSTMLRVTQTNSVLTTTDFDAEQPTGAGHHHLRQEQQQQHHAGEDYFAEYEDFANHKHKKSTKMATPLSPPQAATRRADPPADPPANRLTDDENSTLVGGGASTVFSAGNNTKVGNSTVESVAQKSQYSDLEWEKEDESTTMFHEDDEC